MQRPNQLQPHSQATHSLASTVLRSALAILVLAGSLAALTACNTTAGVGKDVSATGNAVTNTAEKAKQGL